MNKILDNKIVVGFDAKTKRLSMKVPFFLADVAREFPSRRFDNKSKTWRMPLTRQNLDHLERTRGKYEYEITDDARKAIKGYAALTATPVPVPFPYHLYDFRKSKAGFMPMDHQRRMLDAAWVFDAYGWFAKMGTGKTFATIHLACARYDAGVIDTVVIVCPSTLRTTWRKELEKYATVPYNFTIHEPKSASFREALARRGTGKLEILAVSVEGLGVSTSLFESVCGYYIGREVMTVCDESSRIKNPKAIRTNNVIFLGSVSKFRLILNGTPIALGIQDLWSQYEFLDPNIIGTGDYWAFKTHYVQMGGYENKQIVGYKNVDELMRLIQPYTTEVGKEVLNLPPKVMKTVYVQATAEQRRLLKQIKKGYSDDPNAPLIKVDNTLERVLRWRQVVGGWLPLQPDPEKPQVELRQLAESPKFKALIDIIEDNFAGSKFIIWTPFVHEIRQIADWLGKNYGQESVAMYIGETDKEERSRIEDRYCNDSSLRFFVSNPQTAGLGLTLISGENDVMIYYSGTNAYIDRAQSEDRAHRIGQENSVTVIDIVMERTIDEPIQASIHEKMSIEHYIMNRLGGGTGLNTLDLEG